ncbi:MAG TPA: hypothetical protein VG710_15190 [Opitutus sp.]|nr:hypothetical protein [Opitutus sp.]
MPPSSNRSLGRVRAIHPHAWLWEPLENDPTFVLRSMFGAKSVYLSGKIMLCFCAGDEPWRGVLVATDQTRHTALIAEFPELAPHRILPKWLYLSESCDRFERLAAMLVALARIRDPRIGVIPKPKKSKRRPSPRASRPPGHP